MIGRNAIKAVFVLAVIWTARAALGHLDDAIHAGTTSLWLVTAFTSLKVAVALSFAVSVFRRGPALVPCRKPGAYIACAIAICSPLVLKEPASGSAGALVIAGEIIAMAGSAVLFAGAFTLGRSFSVLPEARALVTTGPYRYVRHPVYLGEIIAYSGLLLASLSPLNAALAGLFCVGQFLRMGLEERALKSAFPEYAAYAASTPRLLPSLRLLANSTPWSAATPGRDRRLAALARSLARGQEGQAMTEYVLILTFVSIVSALVLTQLGGDVLGLIQQAVNAFP